MISNGVTMRGAVAAIAILYVHAVCLWVGHALIVAKSVDIRKVGIVMMVACVAVVESKSNTTGVTT
jgi:hypothetical protein